MNHWIKRNTATILATVGIGLGLLATLRASALSYKPASPTSVAVIDWIAVTDKADEWKEMTAQLTKITDELTEQDNATRKRLNELKDSISVLPEGSDSARREEDKLMVESLQYEAWKKFAANKYDTEKARRQVLLYNKITAAVSKIAQRDGWQLVIWNDARSKTPDEKNLSTAPELIKMRSVLYANKEAVDITDEVILLMNNEYNAGH